MADLARYRELLKAQDYLDRNCETPTVQWLSVDLAHLPWTQRVPSVVSWRRVSGVALLHVRPSDAPVVSSEMKKLGFEHVWCLASMVLASKPRPQHLHSNLYRFDETYCIYFADFEQPPVWESLRFHKPARTVLLGTLGIDRYQFSIAAKLCGGLAGHALCLSDADSRRWNLREPCMSYGLFTRTMPKPEWHHVCYVTPDITYADCRPISSHDCGAWIHCRFVWNVAEDISLLLNHPVFRDTMSIDRMPQTLQEELKKHVYNRTTVIALRTDPPRGPPSLVETYENKLTPLGRLVLYTSKFIGRV